MSDPGEDEVNLELMGPKPGSQVSIPNDDLFMRGRERASEVDDNCIAPELKDVFADFVNGEDPGGGECFKKPKLGQEMSNQDKLYDGSEILGGQLKHLSGRSYRQVTCWVAVDPLTLCLELGDIVVEGQEMIPPFGRVSDEHTMNPLVTNRSEWFELPAITPEVERKILEGSKDSKMRENFSLFLTLFKQKHVPMKLGLMSKVFGREQDPFTSKTHYARRTMRQDENGVISVLLVTHHGRDPIPASADYDPDYDLLRLSHFEVVRKTWLSHADVADKFKDFKKGHKLHNKMNGFFTLKHAILSSLKILAMTSKLPDDEEDLVRLMEQQDLDPHMKTEIEEHLKSKSLLINYNDCLQFVTDWMTMFPKEKTQQIDHFRREKELPVFEEVYPSMKKQKNSADDRM